MIKGRVKLDFCDALTGKVKERIEGNNAFTNAIDSLLNRCPCGVDRGTLDGSKQTGESVLNLATTALGGVLIFPDEVTSGANAFYEPMTHQPTAYSRYGAQDTSDTKTGSFNISESSEISNGYRFVHEWGASYGNGTIKTVCLTNIYGAEAYGKKTAFGDKWLFNLPNFGVNVRPLGWSGGYLYYAVMSTGTFGQGAVIKRIKRPLHELLINQATMLNANAETVYTNGSTNEYNGSRIGLDSDGNKLYILYGSSGSNKKLITVDLSVTPVAQTEQTISGTTAIAPVTGASGGYIGIVKRGNYLYFTKENRPSSGAVTIFKVNINNNADFDEISITTASNLGDIRLMTDTNEINGAGFIIGTDDTAYETDTNASQIIGERHGVWQEVKDFSSSASGSAGGSFQINPYYMASKFVLESEYTKNSSLTMKLVYEVTHT